MAAATIIINCLVYTVVVIMINWAKSHIVLVTAVTTITTTANSTVLTLILVGALITVAAATITIARLVLRVAQSFAQPIKVIYLYFLHFCYLSCWME